MAATKIDGTAIARSIREGLKEEILQTQQSNSRFKPSLAIFQGTLLPVLTAGLF
jgi:methylenetetrahydrofolate dehydrogenase (NADP+)/methenyltetrahydrofolate cyclohydrolase/formyltetrahydrofolate synthetase